MSDASMLKRIAVVVILPAAVGCSSPPPKDTGDPELVTSSMVASTSFASSAPQLQREVAAPFSLTSSDGSGLRLIEVDARAVVEGPLAFTELHLYFENTEDRLREGTFSITLPQRAAISRFAMEEAGAMKEAEVVAKALARRAYDDFLHRGIDPALLETAPGNQFTARVFPIMPRAKKHLVLSYSQELANTGYVLPLRGLPKIDEVTITVDVVRPDGTRKSDRMHATAWHPDRDYATNIVTAPAVANGVFVAGAFDVTPSFTEAALDEKVVGDDKPKSLTLLVDTSASRSAGFPRYLENVRVLVSALAARYDMRLNVVAFDQETHAVFDGKARDFGEKQIATLRERGPGGASDLARAVASRSDRVVVVTDGVITAGKDFADLATDAGRIDVVLAGGIRDERVARAIARAGKRPGDVFDLDREELAPIVAGLGTAVRVDVPISVPNAMWWYPRTVPSLRSGMQVVVFAQLAKPAPQLEVAIGNTRRLANIVGATPAVLERAVSRAQIDELETQLLATKDETAAATLRAAIEKKSIASRVVSSQTTMLVLESEQDYVRYGINRRALSDVLVVGPNGIEQTRPTFVAKAEGQYKMRGDHHDPHLLRQQAIEYARAAGMLGSTALRTGDISSGFDDTNVYGGLLGNEVGDAGGSYGTIGFGRASGQGWGSIGDAASGRGGMRGRVANAPAITIGTPVAQGSLDKNVIRRYIKRHKNQIAYCYEKELLARPDLAGTVATQFFIGPGGKVTTATASGVDEKVAKCVADVIKLIEFPTVVDGGVQVNYPFHFRPAGTDAPPDPVQQILDAPPDTTPRPPEPQFTQLTMPIPDERIDDRPSTSDPTAALKGNLAKVMKALAKKDVAGALAIAKKWRDENPGDVLAWVGLGEALEANKDRAGAARAYGSIIDLFGARAEYRRFAGERLERTGETALAVDTYRRAVADRPDQVTGHRLLAYALVRTGDYAGAFKAILAAVDQNTPDDRYAGAPRIFARDAGMIGAAYAANGGTAFDIMRELKKRELAMIQKPSTSFLLYWETDANDVDLHVVDRHGDHAFFQNRELVSGGELYADVTTGFGPECFELPAKLPAGPYELSVHYYAQGPMGYGMGLLQVMRFDGKTFTFEDRPFVIMEDHAHIRLGTVR